MITKVVKDALQCVNGKAMFINRHSGDAVAKKLPGVIYVRPGLDEVTFYHNQVIEGVGTLVIMSDDKTTRYYLFGNLFRGSLKVDYVADSYLGKLHALRGILFATKTYNAVTFNKRIGAWLESRCK